MNNDAIFAIVPIITLLMCIAPIVFIVWILLKFLKVQQEKNLILKNISDKLDKISNKNF